MEFRFLVVSLFCYNILELVDEDVNTSFRRTSMYLQGKSPTEVVFIFTSMYTLVVGLWSFMKVQVDERKKKQRKMLSLKHLMSLKRLRFFLLIFYVINFDFFFFLLSMFMFQFDFVFVCVCVLFSHHLLLFHRLGKVFLLLVHPLAYAETTKRHERKEERENKNESENIISHVHSGFSFCLFNYFPHFSIISAWT